MVQSRSCLIRYIHTQTQHNILMHIKRWVLCAYRLIFIAFAMSITVLAYVGVKHVVSILLLLFQKTIMFSRTKPREMKRTCVYLFSGNVKELEQLFILCVVFHKSFKKEQNPPQKTKNDETSSGFIGSLTKDTSFNVSVTKITSSYHVLFSETLTQVIKMGKTVQRHNIDSLAGRDMNKVGNKSVKMNGCNCIDDLIMTAKMF